jgi:hypothetical protein
VINLGEKAQGNVSYKLYLWLNKAPYKMALY